jgi:hypothetical protein
MIYQHRMLLRSVARDPKYEYLLFKDVDSIHIVQSGKLKVYRSNLDLVQKIKV